MPRKRANGEGNIRKRKDGRWEGRYTAGRNPETGKPITKNVLAKTQSECKEKLKRAVEESSKLDAVRSGTYTVEQWLNLWYENYAAPTIRETTAAYYKNYIDHHIMPKLGDIPLHKLTTLQIQQFYRQAKENGRVQRYEGMTDLSLSGKTIRGMHAMFRQCLEQAVAERLITTNPANGCKLPKKEKREMQVIPSEKIGDYLKAAEEHGVLPMFYLELTTGLRRGELVALLWEDLDVKEQSIRVTKSVLRINGELKVSPPKTQNSVRTVYIPKEAVDLLVEEHKRHPFNKYMFPLPVTEDMYGPDCVGRIHKKLLAKAGIKEKICFHDLRHTFATMSLKNGVDVKTISHILGHYSAGFTLDTYTHVTGDMKKEAAKRIGEVIAI